MEPPAAAASSRPVRLCRRTGRHDGAEDGRGEQPSPSDADGSAGETCANCRIARVRCDKSYPCERCFRLSMCCRPQVRAPRRESNTDVRGCDAPGGAATPVHPQGGLVDHVFARADPRALADVYTQAVVELQRVGLLDRGKALQTARWWWVQSAATGGDASWGFLSAMAAALGFSAVDFEPPSWLARGPPRGQRQREARVLLEAAVGHMAELEQTPAFRHADDGKTAVAVGLPLPAPPGYAEASSRTFKEMWRGMDELLGEDLGRHRTLGSILMLSLLAPDDRLTFARMMFQHTMMRNTRPVTSIVKVFNRQGDIKLYLFEVRPARILPDGSPVGFLFRAEVCPPSRHVTSAPNHAPLASTFRAISRQPLSPAVLGRDGDGDRAAGAAAASASAAAPWAGQQGTGEAVMVLPGVSALPVPSPVLLSADDEAQLVNGLGPRLYPPMAMPVQPTHPPPPPWPAADGASASAPVGPPAAVDLEDGPRRQQQEEQGQQERHQQRRPHAVRGNPWGLDHGNGSSPDSILPMPVLDLDEEDEALLGRLFA